MDVLRARIGGERDANDRQVDDQVVPIPLQRNFQLVLVRIRHVVKDEAGDVVFFAAFFPVSRGCLAGRCVLIGGVLWLGGRANGQQQESEGSGDLSPQAPSRCGREERALARYAISIHCITKYTLKKATAKAIAPIPRILEKPTPTPKAISRRPKRIPTIASELFRDRSIAHRFR
jgi:hypothetical protein